MKTKLKKLFKKIILIININTKNVIRKYQKILIKIINIENVNKNLKKKNEKKMWKLTRTIIKIVLFYKI